MASVRQQSTHCGRPVHEGLLTSCNLGLQICYQGSKAPKLLECSSVQLGQARHRANVVLQDSGQLFVRELAPRRRHRSLYRCRPLAVLISRSGSGPPRLVLILRSRSGPRTSGRRHSVASEVRAENAMSGRSSCKSLILLSGL